jgi:predicted permease
MWRKRKQQDFDAEIEAHLQLEADRLGSEGLTPDEAQAAARRALGNRTAAEERFYESSRWMLFQHFFRDLRFATRVLLKDAKFSILAILGLALGIGVSAGIFAVLGPMLKPHGSNVRALEEVRNPASYVGLDRGPSRNFSFPEYRYFQEHSAALDEISAEASPYSLVLNPISEGADAEDVPVTFESGNSISVLGMRPVLGRGFSKDEEQPGPAPVAMLSHSFWQRRFGGNTNMLGKIIVLNAHAVTIVGVADAKFHQDDRTAIFLPLGLQPLLLGQGDWSQDSDVNWLMVSARLRPGVSMSKAQAESDVLGSSFAESTHPGTARSVDSRVLVSRGGVDRQTQRLAATVTVAVNLIVAMILFIACSNLANLLLARAVVRRREIGIRLSMGASRARLIGQLLTESLLMSIAGGTVGLVFSSWLIKAVSALSPSLVGMASGSELHLDHQALLYALALSVATGFAFGLGPALAATNTNLARALHAEGLSGTPSAPSQKLWSPRNLLVVAPLAVSLMLLIGAAVLVRAIQNGRFEPKFDTSRVIGMSFRLRAQGYDEAKSLQLQDNLRQRLSAMPGVVSVASASSFPLPVRAPFGICSLEAEGPAILANGASICDAVSTGYFETLGVPIVRGRGFSPSDREGSEPVAIVNQELARTYWPDQDPIGKRVRLANGSSSFVVVGVAADLQDPGDQTVFRLLPTAYVPSGQESLLAAAQDSTNAGRRASYQISGRQFFIRASGDPASVKTALRQAVRAADPMLWVDIQTIEEWLEPIRGRQETIALFVAGFGTLALLMACAGIYAILAYAVSQRTREIGIRMALGAQRLEILAMVMQRTLVLISVGIGVGLVGALALSRILAASIRGLLGLDAGTCISLSLLLGAASLLASYLPSRQALRVDPVQALRCE